MLISKKKALNIRLPLLKHLNRTALSKDETALLLRLLEQCLAFKISISKFDEIKEMMSDHNSSDLAPQRQEIPLLEEYYNPVHGHAEDNNDDQALNASIQEDEFINPFCTRVQEIGEHSSRNIDNTDVHSFQPQSHDYRWTRDHPLEQVHGNPTIPVQTR
ncbi:hypothetical protein Tco_1183764 [Tanacetum coccineum]